MQATSCSKICVHHARNRMAVEAATVLGKTHSEILRLLQVVQAGSLALASDEFK